MGGDELSSPATPVGSRRRRRRQPSADPSTHTARWRPREGTSYTDELHRGRRRRLSVCAEAGCPRRRPPPSGELDRSLPPCRAHSYLSLLGSQYEARRQSYSPAPKKPLCAQLPKKPFPPPPDMPLGLDVRFSDSRFDIRFDIVGSAWDGAGEERVRYRERGTRRSKMAVMVGEGRES